MPGAGVVALIWPSASFTIAVGILLISFAFKVKKFKEAEANQNSRREERYSCKHSIRLNEWR